MAKTQALKTGNPGAAKPGKTATYVVTQEAFDVAFDAGRAYAGAYHAAAVALQPLLAPLSGKTDATAVAQWKEYARAFALGMAEARDIDPDSARRAFNRLTDYLGLEKPQTEAARAKQAARAAQAPAREEDDGDSPKDGAGQDGAVGHGGSHREPHPPGQAHHGRAGDRRHGRAVRHLTPSVPRERGFHGPA